MANSTRKTVRMKCNLWENVQNPLEFETHYMYLFMTSQKRLKLRKTQNVGTWNQDFTVPASVCWHAGLFACTKLHQSNFFYFVLVIFTKISAYSISDWWGGGFGNTHTHRQSCPVGTWWVGATFSHFLSLAKVRLNLCPGCKPTVPTEQDTGWAQETERYGEKERERERDPTLPRIKL